MTYVDINLYSPFRAKTIHHKQHHPLLLQFILSELIEAIHSPETLFSPPLSFYPFDWSYEVGCLNRLKEHAGLLPYAFPELKKEVSKFQKSFDLLEKKPLYSSLIELFEHLYPFLFLYKESEHLLFFLLRKTDEIEHVKFSQTVDKFLTKLYPEGIDFLFTLIKNNYLAKGFSSLIPEIDRVYTRYVSRI